MKKIAPLFWGKHARGGQVLLIVVLTMVVALTVGLSIASRTITNLKFSKQSEESQRAFSAAEAGIEQALKTGQNLRSNLQSNNSSYVTTATIQSGTSFLLNGGGIVGQDAGIEVFLASYPTFSPALASATITLYWDTPSQNVCTKSPTTQSALEVLVLSGTILNPTFSKFMYDPCTSTRTPGAIVPGGQGTVESIIFSHSAAITVTNGLLMKVIPIYNSTTIGLSSTAGLPSQGSVISSVGTSGDTVRKVIYFSSFPQTPLELFPYSIIAQ